MKVLIRNLSLIVCLLFSLSVAAQKRVTAPPGTVQLQPSKTGAKHATYIDEREITVFAWSEFLWWTEKEYGKESTEYKSILPDSTICLYAYSAKGGFQHLAYGNFPIVGITYEQAVKYCAWRADRVNEVLKIKKKNYKVSYSLPTEADLKEAYVQYRITYCYPFDQPVNELTAEKTVMIKGWRLSFEPYEEASATVGFRSVEEIHRMIINRGLQPVYTDYIRGD